MDDGTFKRSAQLKVKRFHTILRMCFCGCSIKVSLDPRSSVELHHFTPFYIGEMLIKRCPPVDGGSANLYLLRSRDPDSALSSSLFVSVSSSLEGGEQS